jgi:hypothetical protein
MALWARVLTWGATAGVGVAIVLAPPSDASLAVQIAICGALVALGFAVDRFLGGLTVELYRDELRLFLGRRGPIRKRVALERILSLRSATYRPLREFGGWGVRGFGARQAWTARGDRAVVLHLDDDTELYVGSDRPERLESRIRTAMQTSGVGPAKSDDAPASGEAGRPHDPDETE